MVDWKEEIVAWCRESSLSDRLVVFVRALPQREPMMCEKSVKLAPIFNI